MGRVTVNAWPEEKTISVYDAAQGQAVYRGNFRSGSNLSAHV
jgi:hypothetical protein